MLHWHPQLIYGVLLFFYLQEVELSTVPVAELTGKHSLGH